MFGVGPQNAVHMKVLSTVHTAQKEKEGSLAVQHKISSWRSPTEDQTLYQYSNAFLNSAQLAA